MYIWTGLLDRLAKKKAVGLANGTKPTAALEGFERRTRSEQLDMVRYCKCGETYKGGQHRVTLMLAPSFVDLTKTVVDAMVQLGGVRKQGRPPRGGVERKLEDWFRELQRRG